jgi:hypothetical protein
MSDGRAVWIRERWMISTGLVGSTAPVGMELLGWKAAVVTI